MRDAWTPTIEAHFEGLLPGSRYALETRTTGSFGQLWSHFARWPPNVFAFTWSLLDTSGLYRLAVSPPIGKQWPPDREWETRVHRVAKTWRERPGIPNRILQLGQTLAKNRTITFDRLSTAKAWEVCSAILELHAAADEACAGVGIPGARTKSDKDYYVPLVASWRLADAGTLAYVSPHHVRVLPKLRTPQSGITIRSLSHHLAGHRSEVRVLWDVAGYICPARERRLNLIVLPWPDVVEPNAFAPSKGRLTNMDREEFGFFSFNPRQRFDVRRLRDVVAEAKRRVGRVHGVVLPESSVSVADVAAIQRWLRREDVHMLVAGVREYRGNYAHLGLFNNGRWRTFRQDKHHRWYLDASQIHQYHLGASLHPRRKWWENIDVKERSLRFVSANGWLTICHLICEDLARQEPVGELVRAVGPNLVIALLLDGPQLKTRWPARYASVLADDPGSSVLTVTSVGMAMRSWSSDQPPSRTVALWKDPKGAAREIALPQGHCALLLTLTAGLVKEWSADGRDDGTTAGELVLSGVESIALPTPRR